MQRSIGGWAAIGWLAIAMPAMAQCMPGQTVVEAGFGGKICQGQPRASAPAPRQTTTVTRTYGGAGTNAAAAIFGGLAATGILLDALRPSSREYQQPSTTPDRNDYDREARAQHARGLRLLRAGQECGDAWLTFGVAASYFVKAGNSQDAVIARRNEAVAYACKTALSGRRWIEKEEYSLATQEFAKAADLYDQLGLRDLAARHRKLSHLAQASKYFESAGFEAAVPGGSDRAIEAFENAARLFSENGDSHNSEIARRNAEKIAGRIQAEKAAQAAGEQKARAQQAAAEAEARARKQADEAARKAAREADQRRADARAREAAQADREIREQAAREGFAEAQASSRNPYGDGGRFSEASEENLYYDSACEPNVYCDRVYRDGRSTPPPRKVNLPAPAPVQETPPPDAAAMKARRDEMVRSYLERLKSQDLGENHGDVLTGIQKAYDEASTR